VATGGPTRWWEHAGATPADCPCCGGDGLPGGCLECGEVWLHPDEPYMQYHASESWQHQLHDGGDE